MAFSPASSQHEEINSWINSWTAKWGLPLRQIEPSSLPSSQSESIEDFCIACIKFLNFYDKRRLQRVNEALELHSQVWESQEQDYQHEQECLSDGQERATSHLLKHMLTLLVRECSACIEHGRSTGDSTAGGPLLCPSAATPAAETKVSAKPPLNEVQ